MTTIIERRVCLPARHLDQNIMSHLLAQLTEETFGECTKEYGHILSVERIVDIVSNEELVFTLRYEAKTLKPEKGKKLKGTVCMVYKDGIFLDVAPNQKMLIPSATLIGYEFDAVENIYTGEDSTIRAGDELEAIVTAAQYRKQTFSCFGSLA